MLFIVSCSETGAKKPWRGAADAFSPIILSLQADYVALPFFALALFQHPSLLLSSPSANVFPFLPSSPVSQTETTATG